MKILIFVTVFVIAYAVTAQVADDHAYGILKIAFLYIPFWLVMTGAVVDHLLPKKYFPEEGGMSRIGANTPKVIKLFYSLLMVVCVPLVLGFFVATVIAGKWIMEAYGLK